MTTALFIWSFITSHWPSFTAIALGGPAILVALRSRAYSVFFTLAFELVKEVAARELDGPEKRQWVVDNGYEALPLWAKKFVTKDNLHTVVEKVYQILKEEGKV